MSIRDDEALAALREKLNAYPQVSFIGNGTTRDHYAVKLGSTPVVLVHVLTHSTNGSMLFEFTDAQTDTVRHACIKAVLSYMSP